MTSHTVLQPVPIGPTVGAWRLDPARSRVAFHVRHFDGLMTVR